MAKAETEARQDSVGLKAVGLSVSASHLRCAWKSVRMASVRAALGGFGGAAMLFSAGGAMAGQPPEPSPGEAHLQSGAPLAVLVSANASAADAAAAAPDVLDAPKVMRSRARLQCVPYARELSGVSIRGNANTWWRQAAGRYERAQKPTDGAVMVMRGYNNPNRGHVAVVREILSERSVLIDHANWLNAGEITVNVPVVDVSPNNDWSQVRVWHIPTQSWGVRIYGVQGFIVGPSATQPAGPVTHIAR